MSNARDNVWAICGCEVDYVEPYRIVGSARFDMPLMADEVL